MRTIAASCIIVSVVVAAVADQPNSPKLGFSTWTYPGSTLADYVEHSDTGKTDNEEQTVHFSRGQYETLASFGGVVAFYIKKSGIRVPDEDLVQFEFPSDTVCPAAGAFQGDAKGKAVNVTLLRNIRPTAATVTILVTNDPDSGTTTVTISRGIRDKTTTIQLIQHPVKYLN